MKPIQMVITSNLNSQITPEFKAFLTLKLLAVFTHEPYDMFVIEPIEEQKDMMNIRISGYHYQTNELEEERIIEVIDVPENTPKIWFKIDDYGDYYLSTLMLPEDW